VLEVKVKPEAAERAGHDADSPDEQVGVRERWIRAGGEKGRKTSIERYEREEKDDAATVGQRIQIGDCAALVVRADSSHREQIGEPRSAMAEEMPEGERKNKLRKTL